MHPLPPLRPTNLRAEPFPHRYGTGYCDSDCPHDVKFINGQTNNVDWGPSPVDPKMLLDAETLHALLDEGPLTGAQLAARTLTGGGSSGSASATASLDDQNDACLDAMLKFFA